MEALVYEASPLADYIESRDNSHVPVDDHDQDQTSSPSSSFAPGGYTSLRTQLRLLRQSATDLTKAYDEAFLEHFRYLLIASQVLEEHSRIRPVRFESHPALEQNVTISGAVATAALSFLTVWALHSVLHRPSSKIHWTQYCLLFIICVASTVLVVGYGRRRYSQHVRQNATYALSRLLDESQAFDRRFSSALGLIQEVEVVARGYEISHPLPPISRVEDQTYPLKCIPLRRVLADGLTSLVTQCVTVHHGLNQYTRERDLQQYHVIYNVSLLDYDDALSLLQKPPLEKGESLRDLRLSFEAFSLARKVMLCDLLALQPESDNRQWLAIFNFLQGLANEMATITQMLGEIQGDEETAGWGMAQDPAIVMQSPINGLSEGWSTPKTDAGNDQVKVQMRRLEGLANSIRSLNAKMILFRHETDAATDRSIDNSVMSSTLSKQYESLGIDIRALVSEWEQGRKAMLTNRYSRSSSGLRSPISPSPSLGGRTMVEDGPLDALRVLNGDENSRKMSDFGTSDEEIFEAVALPRKRMSTFLSREERVAKLEDERRKRATMHEHSERQTNMLRELEMVIKHRPRGRTTSRIPSV